jgi:hypothetical protein
MDKHRYDIRRLHGWHDQAASVLLLLCKHATCKVALAPCQTYLLLLLLQGTVAVQALMASKVCPHAACGLFDHATSPKAALSPIVCCSEGRHCSG